MGVTQKAPIETVQGMISRLRGNGTGSKRVLNIPRHNRKPAVGGGRALRSCLGMGRHRAARRHIHPSDRSGPREGHGGGARPAAAAGVEDVGIAVGASHRHRVAAAAATCRCDRHPRAGRGGGQWLGLPGGDTGGRWPPPPPPWAAVSLPRTAPRSSYDRWTRPGITCAGQAATRGGT